MQRNSHFLTFLILLQNNKNVIPGWHSHNPEFGNHSKEHPECYKALGVTLHFKHLQYKEIRSKL